MSHFSQGNKEILAVFFNVRTQVCLGSLHSPGAYTVRLDRDVCGMRTLIHYRNSLCVCVLYRASCTIYRCHQKKKLPKKIPYQKPGFCDHGVCRHGFGFTDIHIYIYIYGSFYFVCLSEKPWSYPVFSTIFAILACF